MKDKIIQFRNIVKEFDGQVVLKGVNLDIYENEFVTLLGPSGCGKTTLLRILGGFLDVNEGQIIFNGEDITHTPPHKRELNTVFQKYALFPHMNVAENIAFGLKIRKISDDVIEQKVMKMLKLIGLEGYENKDVTRLSGGQQQRVAIARALVNEPKVLLLDEPLGALDLKLRKEMQYELKRIQQEVGITFIFVTHDQEEALTMSDKIAVMNRGEVYQLGSPQEIYNEPENKYVASFIGESNIVNGIMIDDYKVKFDDREFECVDFGFKKNEPVDIVIRPEDIDIVEKDSGKMNGVVDTVFFKGVYYVDVEDMKELDEKEIIARADAQAWSTETDEYISIAKIEYDLKGEIGTYPVRFYTPSGTWIERRIHVIDQPYVVNEKSNEAVSAFNFYKTVEEIVDSVALDTDLKTWANAQGWKLNDEEAGVDIYVSYDFNVDDLKEGVYKVTFSTEGREFKINTTDFVEEGKEVGLDFHPQDIHVMRKRAF